MSLLSKVVGIFKYKIPAGNERHALALLATCPKCSAQFDGEHPAFGLDDADVLELLSSVRPCSKCKREIEAPVVRKANGKRQYVVTDVPPVAVATTFKAEGK